MFNNKNIDRTLPSSCSRNLYPEMTSASVVNISDAMFIDIARDYNNHESSIPLLVQMVAPSIWFEAGKADGQT